MDRRGRASGHWDVWLRRVLSAGIFLPVIAATSPADAQALVPAVLAAPCAACHGTGGTSPGTIPSIDQYDAATLAARLRGFRSGEIEATVMNRIAKGYTDAEIEALAKYFGALHR